MITILLFARLREALGSGSLSLEWNVEPDPGSWTVERLLAMLTERYPDVGFANVMVALNEQYAGPGVPIPPGSTVALIPPVSGG